MSKKRATKKEITTSIEGMHDIQGSEYFARQGLFEKASEIALYYGFNPIELPILEKEILYTASVGIGTDIIDKELHSFRMKGDARASLRPDGSPGVIRAYIEHGMQSAPQPVMFYHYGSFFRDKNINNDIYKECKRFGLEIIGTSKSIADATVIKVTSTILKEAGFKDVYIQINSIGDLESRQSYIKELISYYRKNISNICTTCQERLKTNPMQLLMCQNDKCQDTKINAPDSISFLSTPSKKHFREVLEYLDSMDITYEINNSLVRGSNYYNQTIFKIIEQAETKKTEESETEQDENENTDPKKPNILAEGGRYDCLAKRLGCKKEIPSVGASIEIDCVVNSPAHKPINPRIRKRPKVYFVQLGFEAKQKSLTVIETLRQARIPIMHSLAKDRLSAQLSVAEKLKIPYTVILGQREALDNTVIIRNMKTCSQETININKLSDYIKNKLK